ncbi:MAG: zf-HC2 domain-containing protein [Oscillospiraceae bacterium]|nr:zf-HC2 domain-containing protein [Oscillospiraceae bacterium]
MKITCDIVRDLLPLYHDGVCSQDSRQLVEEHLSSCERCADDLSSMDSDLSISQINQNLDTAKSTADLSKRWKKTMHNWLFGGILSTAAVIALILLLLYIFVDIQIN